LYLSGFNFEETKLNSLLKEWYFILSASYDYDLHLKNRKFQLLFNICSLGSNGLPDIQFLKRVLIFRGWINKYANYAFFNLFESKERGLLTKMLKIGANSKFVLIFYLKLT